MSADNKKASAKKSAGRLTPRDEGYKAALIEIIALHFRFRKRLTDFSSRFPVFSALIKNTMMKETSECVDCLLSF